MQIISKENAQRNGSGADAFSEFRLFLVFFPFLFFYSLSISLNLSIGLMFCHSNSIHLYSFDYYIWPSTKIIIIHSATTCCFAISAKTENGVTRKRDIVVQHDFQFQIASL